MVNAMKKIVILGAARALLEPRLSRKKAEIEASSIANQATSNITEEIEDIEALIAAIKDGKAEACENWEMETTWIIARKAVILDRGDSWMNTKYIN